MKRFFTIAAAMFLSIAAFAQDRIVTWSAHTEKADGDLYKVVFTGKIVEGYHTYTLTDEFSATEFTDVEINGGELVGKPYEISTPVEEIDEFGEKARHYYNEIVIGQNVKLTAAEATMTGSIFTNACTGGQCRADYFDFDIIIDPSAAVAVAAEETASAPKERSGNIWMLILEAILWGFAMLLTPCAPTLQYALGHQCRGGGDGRAWHARIVARTGTHRHGTRGRAHRYASCCRRTRTGGDGLRGTWCTWTCGTQRRGKRHRRSHKRHRTLTRLPLRASFRTAWRHQDDRDTNQCRHTAQRHP